MAPHEGTLELQTALNSALKIPEEEVYFSMDEDAEDPEEGAWEVTFPQEVRWPISPWMRRPRIQRRERGR